MYYLCTYNLIVYSNYYRRKGRSSYSCLFYVLTVYDCIHTVSRAGLHGSKRFLSNRVTVIRRFIMTQKTVYDLKLLVIFLKKSVMFFKKLVMFYQGLATPCCIYILCVILTESHYKCKNANYLFLLSFCCSFLAKLQIYDSSIC